MKIEKKEYRYFTEDNAVGALKKLISSELLYIVSINHSPDFYPISFTPQVQHTKLGSETFLAFKNKNLYDIYELKVRYFGDVWIGFESYGIKLEMIHTHTNGKELANWYRNLTNPNRPANKFNINLSEKKIKAIEISGFYKEFIRQESDIDVPYKIEVKSNVDRLITFFTEQQILCFTGAGRSDKAHLSVYNKSAIQDYLKWYNSMENQWDEKIFSPRLKIE